MGCGASFRSLDLLTKHMQETQHYKKVISQDQISSWKYPEAQPSPKNHVNSVLTCKVCDKGFSSLKELSDHMIRNNHYNGDSKPSPGARSQPTAAQAQAAKERKKALPVKKVKPRPFYFQIESCSNQTWKLMLQSELSVDLCKNKTNG